MCCSFLCFIVVWIMPRLARSVALFFFNDTATTEIYTLSLHDALPISVGRLGRDVCVGRRAADRRRTDAQREPRSEKHTSELQSPCNLVCRLLLEKKKKTSIEQRLPNRAGSCGTQTTPEPSGDAERVTA